MNQTFWLLTVAGSLVLLMPTAVWAGSYSVTGAVDEGGNASVVPFDSTKGTLTGVSWTASLLPFVDVQLMNNTSQDIINVNLSFSALNVSGTAPDGSTRSASGSGSIHYDGIVAGFSADEDGSISLSLPSTSVDASKLSFYDGPGQPNFTFSIPTYTLGTLPTGTSIVSQFSAYVFNPSSGEHGSVNVTYTFTPNAVAAPEPSTLTLLGLGSLGLLGYGRRRRKA
jgi:hypothetical protein